jgi:hypothetical protein
MGHKVQVHDHSLKVLGKKKKEKKKRHSSKHKRSKSKQQKHKKTRKNPMMEGRIHKVFKEDNLQQNSTTSTSAKASTSVTTCCPLPGNPLADSMYHAQCSLGGQSS